MWVSVLLIVGHFMLPYVLLLNRDLKRTGGTVATIAAAVIVMRLVDLFWLLGPEHGQPLLSVHWLDVVAPVALGGIWVALFLWQLGTRSLIPMTEPTLQEAIEAGAGTDELQIAIAIADCTEVTQMSEHNTHDDVGHEETDAEVGPLVRFAIFLTLVTLVCAARDGRFLQVPRCAASRPRRRRAIR